MHNDVDVDRFKVVHNGVQFMDGREDTILAGLLYFALETELMKLVFDVGTLQRVTLINTRANNKH